MAGRPHRRGQSHHHRYPDDDVSKGTTPILQARQSPGQKEVQAEHQRGRTAEMQRKHQRSVHGVSELPTMPALCLLCPPKRGHGETQPQRSVHNFVLVIR